MTLDSLYFWLTTFTVLVIIGVILEGDEIFSELRAYGWKHLKHKLASIGFALLVIGLAGELFFQTKIESADAELKRQSDIKISIAQTDAAKANERAAEASRIAEEERLARVKIEERIARRELSESEIKRLSEALKPFIGRPLLIKSYAGDVEGHRLLFMLATIFLKAGLNPTPGHWGFDESSDVKLLLGIEIQAPPEQKDLEPDLKLVDRPRGT